MKPDYFKIHEMEIALGFEPTRPELDLVRGLYTDGRILNAQLYGAAARILVDKDGTEYLIR